MASAIAASVAGCTAILWSADAPANVSAVSTT
jgi:hypothetical protein